MALTQLVVPLQDLEKTEKAVPQLRLIAVTHGDPTDSDECGRPIFYRAKTSLDRDVVPALVAVCPLHGDVQDIDANRAGYMGLFAFRSTDMRPRRKLE